jgi:hypothetical protein
VAAVALADLADQAQLAFNLLLAKSRYASLVVTPLGFALSMFLILLSDVAEKLIVIASEAKQSRFEKEVWIASAAPLGYGGHVALLAMTVLMSRAVGGQSSDRKAARAHHLSGERAAKMVGTRSPCGGRFAHPTDCEEGLYHALAKGLLRKPRWPQSRSRRLRQVEIARVSRFIIVHQPWAC